MSYCIAWLNIDSNNHQYQNVQEQSSANNIVNDAKGDVVNDKFNSH